MKQESLKILITKFSNLFIRSSVKLKPNFLIPGAGRSGTTTLYNYLKQHPEVFLPENKEPNFFSLNYNLGYKWYLHQFRSVKKVKAVGEASTTYFDHENAIKKIYKFNPNFKLIFILRNPVERAFSGYKWDIQHLGEIRSFKDIIRENERYLWPGKYFYHISRFLNYFPKNKMIFIIFEKFIKNELKYMKKISEFLGLNPSFNFDSKKIKKNPSKMPLSISLQKKINKSFNSNPKEHISKRTIKYGCRIVLNRINHLWKFQDFPNMDEITRNYLRNYFKKEIIKLEEIIEKDLSLWD